MNKTQVPRVVLCDLDGVVWLAHRPIAGSVEAIAQLRQAGVRVLFVTNNSFSTLDEQHQALGAIGVPATGDVVTSAMSAVTAIKPSWRVLVCGGRGLIEEVRATGAETVVVYENRPVSGSFDAVVVGFHREFDFQVLADALTAVRGGALGVTALITGKPCAPMAVLVRDTCPGVDVADMVMVGDRDDTDGAFARTLGCRFALVLSGVTPDGNDIAADIVAPTLAGVVQQLLTP